MKFVILLVSIMVLQSASRAQNLTSGGNTTIYLVRHAEKEKGNDPLLTEAGKQRAGDLMRTLKSKHLQRIYVTQYHRTQMTADSLRIQLAIDTVHYLADTTGDDLLEKIKLHNDFGKIFLVIGHSNTLPAIIKKLGVTKQVVPEIADNEFDYLFIVKLTKGKATLTIKKYGIKSQKTSTGQAMQPLQ